MSISVIIPIFNGEVYLEQCVESIVHQLSMDDEIILIDDGSTDNTESICNTLISKYNNVLYYYKENGGQFSARLFGINVAKKDYILPVDCDDLLRNDTLDILRSRISSRAIDVIIYNGSRELSFDKPLSNYPFRDNDIIEEDTKEIIFNFIIQYNSLNSFCMKLYSSKLLKSINWDVNTISKMRYGEDMMQLLPVLTKANSIMYCDEVLYYYRPNMSSVSKNYKSDLYDSRKIIYHKLIEYSNEWILDKNKTIKGLNLRTLRNIVSIIKLLKSEKLTFQIKEITRIAEDEWGRNIYKSTDTTNLALSERLIIFMLYHRLYALLIIILKM